MSDQQKLSELMKSDWNRRVTHDYRFWMSDGHKTDTEMWETGERDLAIITNGVQECASKSILEIGCGVGRLLKPALVRFGKVIGIDVSDAAITKARELLGANSKLELYATNGIDLSMLQDCSIDCVISFAAITSMPTEVIAGYLREIYRVIKADGVVRLQMYLGEPQKVSQKNTLHLRCFTRENFANAMAAAGFKVQSVTELVLPFQVSSKEWGIEAVVVSLEKAQKPPTDTVTIARLLLPEGEPVEEQNAESISTIDLEYWMTLNYAKDLLRQGEISRARDTLNYAVQQCQGATVDAKALLEELVTQLEASERLAKQPSTQSSTYATPISGSDIFERNLRVIQEKFPEWANKLRTTPDFTPGVEVKDSADGPIYFEDGQCLDHATKPVSAGQQWAKRLLLEDRIKTCHQIVVFGGGGLYHIEALLHETTIPVALIEPRFEVFWRLITTRDVSQILSRLSGLSLGRVDNIPFFNDASELVVRPQTQVVAGEYCSKLRSLSYGKRGLTALHPNIAVLGPLQGGTLPIAGYVTRALGELKQRVKPWDVSGFAQGYHVIEDFLKGKQIKQGSQNNYCEFISQMLLDASSESRIDILICMAQAPISGRVLSELRKRGTITVLWFVEDYMRFHYWREMARYYDFVFTIQKGECIDLIKQAGAGEVHYLPTACDPLVHRPINLNDEDKQHWGSPVSFVGAGYHNRQQVFASFAHMPFKIWGTEWPTCRPFDRLVQENARRLTPTEYIKIFNATDVNVNLHSSSERDGVDPFGDFVNPRTFELAATGAFQLVDERSLLPEVFEYGTEVATFKSPADLKEKIEYYAQRPDERRKIAEKARERVLRDHTYTHRMREMLSIIYSSKFEQLKRIEDASPWHKMLERASKHEELHERCKRSFDRGELPTLDGIVSDIVTGKGALTETEQKLLFLFHIRKQIIRMKAEEAGENK